MHNVLGIYVGHEISAYGVYSEDRQKISGNVERTFTPKSLLDTLDAIRHHHVRGVDAIGVCLEGVVDEHGIVIRAPYGREWMVGLDLSAVLSEAFMLPVVALNDVVAIGRFLGSDDSRESVVLSFDTSIRCCWFKSSKELIYIEPSRVQSILCERSLAQILQDNKSVMCPDTLAQLIHGQFSAISILQQAYDKEERWAQNAVRELFVPELVRIFADIFLRLPFEKIWWSGHILDSTLRLPWVMHLLHRGLIKDLGQNVRLYQSVPKNSAVIGAALYALDKYPVKELQIA